MTTLLVAIVLLVLLTSYVTWTANRLDRLHARVDGAWAALDAQLLRRAAAARVLAARLGAPELDTAARAALDADESGRETYENALSRALSAALSVAPAPGAEGSQPVELDELATAATRVGLARSFHNAAVRDTRAVRLRRLPRALRLAGHRSLPQYFEIDDTRLAG